MKASSQTGGWKGMLIQHGEKAVLGIIGALVIWMMISGMQTDGLKPDKSPDNLTSRVKNGEDYINTAVRIKDEKFSLKPYDKNLVNGLEPVQIDFYSVLDGPNFPKIAKRAQPQVYPVEEVHATALVVQVALNDEKAVKQQQIMVADRNDKKARDEAKKAAALAQKKQAEEAKKAKALANQQSRPTRGGGGEGGKRERNPLQGELPTIEAPVAPLVERPRHPAIQNMTGIMSTTKGIAVVTGLIPYKKQLEEFNRAIVDGKDIVPGRRPEEDSPWIATFVVERARVVNPNEPDDKLVWENITPQAQQFFAENGKKLTRSDDPVILSLHGPETVGLPKKNIPGWYTVSPLPTLADRKWQREVTHPRIPLITDLTDEEIKIEEANAFMPAAPIGGGPGGFGQPAPVAAPVMQEIELPEYVLFRHIDFNVAPGQTYRYRVSLAYLNPNLGLDSKYLGTDVAVTEVLPTAASKPSNSVALAPLHQLVAGGDVSYPPPKRYDAVPSTRVWQWLIDIDVEKRRGGGEVAKDFPGINVGDLLEFVGTVKNNLNRAAGQAEELVDYNFTAHKIPRGTQMPFLVDVSGKSAPPPPRPRPVPPGGVAPPPVAEPPREQPYSEILYVDQDGKLRSSSSPYAETLIDNYKLRYESLETSPSGGGGGEMQRQPGAEILFKGGAA